MTGAELKSKELNKAWNDPLLLIKRSIGPDSVVDYIMSCNEIKKIVKGKVYLDVGGGFSGIQYAAIESRMSVAINILRSHLKNNLSIDLGLQNVFRVQGDTQNLPLRSGSIDVVLTAHTLEHIPDYKAALGEIKRVLKLKGELVIILPNELAITGYNFLNPKRAFRILMGKGHNFENVKPFAKASKDGPTYHGHLHIFDIKSLSKYLEECGFEIIDTKQGFFFVLGIFLQLWLILYYIRALSKQIIGKMSSRFLYKLQERHVHFLSNAAQNGRAWGGLKKKCKYPIALNMNNVFFKIHRLEQKLFSGHIGGMFLIHARKRKTSS